MIYVCKYFLTKCNIFIRRLHFDLITIPIRYAFLVRSISMCEDQPRFLKYTTFFFFFNWSLIRLVLRILCNGFLILISPVKSACWSPRRKLCRMLNIAGILICILCKIVCTYHHVHSIFCKSLHLIQN